MGNGYIVHVSFELADDISDDDLAAVRWLVGLGPEPATPLPEQELGYPDFPVASPGTDPGPGGRVPGGAHAHLRPGTGPGGAGWGVTAMECLMDDTFQQSTLPALQWLATVSRTQGLIATAIREFDPFPSWFIYSFNQRPYLLHRGKLVPFDAGDPPPPEHAARDLERQLRRLAGC